MMSLEHVRRFADQFDRMDRCLDLMGSEMTLDEIGRRLESMDRYGEPEAGVCRERVRAIAGNGYKHRRVVLHPTDRGFRG